MTELKIVGREEDVARFQVGDMVIMHLELRDQVFLDAPHGETGVVVDLSYEDSDYHYNLPIIQFGAPSSELRMCNPDYLIVMMREDGSEPEKDRLEVAMQKTNEKIQQVAAESSESSESSDDKDQE